MRWVWALDDPLTPPCFGWLRFDVSAEARYLGSDFSWSFIGEHLGDGCHVAFSFSRLLVGGAAGGGLPDVDRPRSAIRLLEPPPAGL
jgi:hypothetical protein